MNFEGVTNKFLDTLDLKHLEPYATGPNNNRFDDHSGEAHYRLLAYISTLFNNALFVDIGTFHGWSALALSNNKNNKIMTYDLFNFVDKEEKSIKNISNIEIKQKNILEEIHILDDASLVFLDVDPHDGIQERQIYEKILTTNFNGILICDDIKLRYEMMHFWESIQLPKKDVSYLGHSTGTGIVYFSNKNT